MRLAFITSCLEPGRDGVGDYTRALALQCQQQGHCCCLLALRDSWIEGDKYLHEEAPGRVPEMRLPPSLSWGQRTGLASEFLDRFGPDWVSLQFVPYGFHVRGIASGLGKYLRPLAAGRRAHVMFHELWIGEQPGAPLKERAVGAAQKACVLSLLKYLQPRALHTSNAAYIQRLARCGLEARMLPMFGAIPVGQSKGDSWLLPALCEAGLDLDGGREAGLLLGFFGSLHPVWPPEPLLSLLEQAGHQSGRRAALLSIGRLGPGEELWKYLCSAYGEKFTFLKLGEQPAERVSQFFLSLDAGIATSPYTLLGKSSSVAAMLEHGLRVIVNRDDAAPGTAPALDPERERLLLRLGERFTQEIAAPRQRAPLGLRLPQVASQFVRDLESAS